MTKMNGKAKLPGKKYEEKKPMTGDNNTTYLNLLNMGTEKELGKGLTVTSGEVEIQSGSTEITIKAEGFKAVQDEKGNTTYIESNGRKVVVPKDSKNGQVKKETERE